MKFDVKSTLSDKLLFTAKIDCDEGADNNIKLGLAVCWAIENNIKLYGADLRDANLYSANLRNANLVGANLYSADLRSANLYSADLRSANLRDAYLVDADLRGANLVGANLRGADLRGANLVDADLRGADLYSADLRGAENLISFGPIGNKKRIGFAVSHQENVMILLGCFWGSADKAIKQIKKEYGASSGYIDIIKAACKCLMEFNNEDS